MDNRAEDVAGRQGPDPGDIHSMRLMSNILDLASSAGNLAEALRGTGIGECRAMAQADMFVSAVRSLRGWRDGHRRNHGVGSGSGDERGYATGIMSPEDWGNRHAQALEIARHLQLALWELPGADQGEAREHLGRLDRKIVDGQRLGLSTASPDRPQASSPGPA